MGFPKITLSHEIARIISTSYDAGYIDATIQTMEFMKPKKKGKLTHQKQN